MTNSEKKKIRAQVKTIVDQNNQEKVWVPIQLLIDLLKMADRK